MSTPPFGFSRPVGINEIGKGGLEYSIEADAEERAALADRFGIAALPLLKAEIRVKRWRKGGAHLVARVSGRMVRRCVVSLEEFELPFEEEVDIRYAARGDEIGMAPQDGELVLDPSSNEPPEVLEGEGFDVGEAIAQQIVLTLDPYPRKPGVEFEKIEEKVRKTSPFSVLSGLKSDENKGQKQG